MYMYINKNNKNEISTFWSHVLIPGIEFVNNFLCCFISGGFYHSDLLLRHIISAYVPFLPLEREHIRECIKDYLLSRKYYKTYRDISEEKVKEIAEQLQYYPKEEQIFSKTGCKGVPDKTAYVMDVMEEDLYRISTKTKMNS